VIRAGLGIAIAVFLLYHFGARAIFQAIGRERPAYFITAVIIYTLGQLIPAWRWQMLAAIVKVHGAFTEFASYVYIAMFTNLFVPGLLGGDAARSIYLGRRHSRMGEAVASVVADRALGLIVLFWLAAFAAIFLNFAALPPAVTHPVIAVGAAAMAGYLASPLVARLIHLMPGPIRRAGGIVAPYLHHPLELIGPIGLSLLLQVELAFCQFVLARGLGLPFGLSLFVLCVPISNVFTSLPLTLGGIGVREAANVALFGMAGMRKDDAIALGLLWDAALMLGGLAGAIAFVTTPSPGSTGHPGKE